MSQPGRTAGPPVRALVVALAACLSLPVALGGCGGPATFISATPPPDVFAEVWYKSPIPAVRDAVRQAMLDARITVDAAAGNDAEVIGAKQQVPYVGEGAGEPTPGPLPVYRVTATLTKQGDTHVRASVDVACPTCNGKVPYEWGYPDDLLRDIFDGASRILNERSARVSYPPRHRPVRWRPPQKH